LSDDCKHVSKDVGDVDAAREVSEEFGRLPLHDTWKENTFSHINDAIDGFALRRRRFCKLMP